MSSKNLDQFESNNVEYGEKFLSLLTEGYMPIKVKSKVSFVKIPMLDNVSVSVRKGLGMQTTNAHDSELVKFIQTNLIRPYSFDVVDHLARRIFNYSKAAWKNLEVEVREGFLTMTHRSIMGAIAKGRME